MKCTKQEHRELMLQICSSIDKEDWEKVIGLGKELKRLEDPAVRRIPDISDYEPLEKTVQLAKLTTTVYRVSGAVSELPNLMYLTTTKDLARTEGITVNEAFKQRIEDGSKVYTPIAEVTNEWVNKIVFVKNLNGEIIDRGFYLDVALDYGIHVEDLHNAIEDKMIINDLTFEGA